MPGPAQAGRFLNVVGLSVELGVERMRGRGSRLVGVIATVVVLGGLFVLLVLGVRAVGGLGTEPPAAAATQGPSVTLSVFPNSYPCHGNGSGAPGGGANPGWVTYCPSTSIKVPAYSTVTMTIKQYDTATPLHNSFFAEVWGTVGNVMYVNGRPIREINADAPGHTFTIQTPPNPSEFQLFVSIPLTGVPASAPNTVRIAGQMYPKPVVTAARACASSPSMPGCSQSRPR